MEKHRGLCAHLRKVNLGARKRSFVSSQTVKYRSIQQIALFPPQPSPHQVQKSPLRSENMIVTAVSWDQAGPPKGLRVYEELVDFAPRCKF